jgi:hypothetical protein
LYWFAQGEPYVPYKTMLKIIVSSTSCSSNIYGVINDNSNRYRSMVIDATWMNHGYSSESSHVNKEPNVDETRLF